MGEQPGARQQHVAGQLRIVQLQRLHGLVHAGPQRQVRAPALEQQVGEEQQEARDDRQQASTLYSYPSLAPRTDVATGRP